MPREIPIQTDSPNIEKVSHRVTNELIAKIFVSLCSFCVLLVLFVRWYDSDKAAVKQDNTEVRGLIKDLKNDVTLQLERQANLTTINFMLVNHKVDSTNTQLKQLQTSIKQFNRHTLVTERKTPSGMTFTTSLR